MISMKRGFLLFAAAVFALMMLIAHGCRKDEPVADFRAAKDHAIAETVFFDIFKYLFFAASDTSLYVYKSGCPSVTVTPGDTLYPKVFSVDFGSACTDSNNITRSGILTAGLNAPLFDSLSLMTISFNGYHRVSASGDFSPSGTFAIKCLGRNIKNYLHFSAETQNGQIQSGTVALLWNATLQFEWVQGESTLWPETGDDVFLVTGSYNGIDGNGNAYSVSITSPLVVPMGCGFIVQGNLEISQEGQPVMSIDYGTGDCDNSVKVTVNGNTYSFLID